MLSTLGPQQSPFVGNSGITVSVCQVRLIRRLEVRDANTKL